MRAQQNPYPNGYDPATVVGLIAIVMIILLLAGCKPAPASRPQERIDQHANSGRFVVESHGWFYGGMADNKREIFVITDSKTKKSYLGVSGVGVTELYEVSDGETSHFEEE